MTFYWKTEIRNATLVDTLLEKVLIIMILRYFQIENYSNTISSCIQKADTV